MKTLTLFRAFVRTADEYWGMAGREREIDNYREKRLYHKMLSKRQRQSLKFQHALTKRLQEQEEELAFYRTVRHVGETYKDAWEQLAKGENK